MKGRDARSVMRVLENFDDETLFAEVQIRLARPRIVDWVSAFEEGDILTCEEAGTICGVSGETIRRRAAAAVGTDESLGILVANAWLISLTRLLVDVERREGPHGRLAAMARAKKLAETRLSPRILTRSVEVATR
jgi:hypothetical protein